MPNIVYLFCGPAGSGKDTSFQFFKKILQTNYPEFNIQNYAFGDTLKEIVNKTTILYTGHNYPVEQMSSLEYKEQQRHENQIYVNGKQQPLVIRVLLQQIGTNILREELGEDIFAECVVKKIKQQFKQSNQIAIITDLRFPNELKCVEKYCIEKDHRYFTIYVQRDLKITHQHVSESFYDTLPKDYIINNNGSLDDLSEELEKVLTIKN